MHSGGSPTTAYFHQQMSMAFWKQLAEALLLKLDEEGACQCLSARACSRYKLKQHVISRSKQSRRSSKTVSGPPQSNHSSGLVSQVPGIAQNTRMILHHIPQSPHSQSAIVRPSEASLCILKILAGYAHLQLCEGLDNSA